MNVKNEGSAMPLDMVAEASEGMADDEVRRPRKHQTLYHAVAGTVMNKTDNRWSGPRIKKHSTRETPMGPDELLFRRKGAPERYAEHDIYYANERDLPRGGRVFLPDSDLLKAIHSYSSHFYAAHRTGPPPPGEANVDERSMDETALLAFGILLEEAGREVLGRSGDLVFTEAAETQDDLSGDEMARESSHRVAVGHQVGSRVAPRKKRRKVAGSEAPNDATWSED